MSDENASPVPGFGAQETGWVVAAAALRGDSEGCDLLLSSLDLEELRTATRSAIDLLADSWRLTVPPDRIESVHLVIQTLVRTRMANPTQTGTQS